MTDWYVQHPDPELEEQFIGPLRPSELLKMVREGEVGPEHLLRKDDSAWFEAREVGGLFEAAMRPTICLFCPSAMPDCRSADGLLQMRMGVHKARGRDHREHDRRRKISVIRGGKIGAEVDGEKSPQEGR